MATAKRKKAGPWGVFEYEVMMFVGTAQPYRVNAPPEVGRVVTNALTESRVLHNRILCCILLSRGSETDGDILLRTLLPGFGSKKIAKLAKAYGNRNKRRSPCWTFNKMVAHATIERFDKFDYQKKLAVLNPHITKLLEEIVAERERRGV